MYSIFCTRPMATHHDVVRRSAHRRSYHHHHPIARTAAVVGTTKVVGHTIDNAYNHRYYYGK